ncbi:hypothetical protein GQ54DRAFT_340653 [Martensiomyces pterosporus]|nr:hypothetical protein GQ54DRAFT_340653 [Martensiomyces pterosporus]
MFYSQDLLCRRSGRFGTIWLLGTSSSRCRWHHVSNKEVASIDIQGVCSDIAFPQAPLALRLTSTLLVGLSRALNRKAMLLYADCHSTWSRILSTPWVTSKQGFNPAVTASTIAANIQAITLPDTITPVYREQADDVGLWMATTAGCALDDIKDTHRRWKELGWLGEGFASGSSEARDQPRQSLPEHALGAAAASDSAHSFVSFTSSWTSISMTDTHARNQGPDADSSFLSDPLLVETSSGGNGSCCDYGGQESQELVLEDDDETPVRFDRDGNLHFAPTGSTLSLSLGLSADAHTEILHHSTTMATAAGGEGAALPILGSSVPLSSVLIASHAVAATQCEPAAVQNTGESDEVSMQARGHIGSSSGGNHYDGYHAPAAQALRTYTLESAGLLHGHLHDRSTSAGDQSSTHSLRSSSHTHGNLNLDDLEIAENDVILRRWAETEATSPTANSVATSLPGSKRCKLGKRQLEEVIDDSSSSGTFERHVSALWCDTCYWHESKRAKVAAKLGEYALSRISRHVALATAHAARPELLPDISAAETGLFGCVPSEGSRINWLTGECSPSSSQVSSVEGGLFLDGGGDDDDKLSDEAYELEIGRAVSPVGRIQQETDREFQIHLNLDIPWLNPKLLSGMQRSDSGSRQTSVRTESSIDSPELHQRNGSIEDTPVSRASSMDPPSSDDGLEIQQFELAANGLEPEAAYAMSTAHDLESFLDMSGEGSGDAGKSWYKRGGYGPRIEELSSVHNCEDGRTT